MRWHLDKEVNDKEVNRQAEKQPVQGRALRQIHTLALLQKQVLWLEHNEQCGWRSRQGQVAGG